MLRAGGKKAHHGRYLFFLTLAGLLAFAEEAWARDDSVREPAGAIKPASLNTAAPPRGNLTDPAKADIRKHLFTNPSIPRPVAKRAPAKVHQAPDVEFTMAMRHLAQMPLNDEDKKTPFTLGFQGRYLRFSIGW